MGAEIWKPVVGYDGRYEVSSFGRVRSLDRRVQRHDGFYQTHFGRVLRHNIGTHGYPAVALCNGGKSGRTRTVHSLVAEAFLGPRPEGHDIRHGNGDRADPRLSNLCYGTKSENQLDRRAHGTAMFGEKNPSAKLTAEDVRVIRSQAKGGCDLTALSCKFRVSEATIRDAVSRRTWAEVQ